MASKKYDELQGFEDGNLATQLDLAKKEYQQMRFDNYSRGIESPAKIKDLRRDIARLHTETRRRELAQMNEGAGRPAKQTRRARLKAKQV